MKKSHTKKETKRTRSRFEFLFFFAIFVPPIFIQNRIERRNCIRALSRPWRLPQQRSWRVLAFGLSSFQDRSLDLLVAWAVFVDEIRAHNHTQLWQCYKVLHIPGTPSWASLGKISLRTPSSSSFLQILRRMDTFLRQWNIRLRTHRMFSWASAY